MARISVLEHVLLKAVALTGSNAYGIIIFETAVQLARPERISFGSIYATLDRLEEAGYLKSRLTHATAERGGKTKRCFVLTATGERRLADADAFALRLATAARVDT